MQTLTHRLARLAATSPSRIFATFIRKGRSEHISFEQLFRQSSNCARRISAEGVGRDDVVIVMLNQSPEQLYWFLGAMLAGAIPTFMPTPSTKQRLDFFVADHKALFERLHPRVLVTTSGIAPHFDRQRVIFGDDPSSSRSLDDSERMRPIATNPDDIACLQHSSGTTSLKKGVMLTHRAIFEQVSSYAKATGFSADDAIVSWLPLYHDMGFIACFMMPLVSGSRIIVLDPFEWVAKPHLLLDVVSAHHATLCWLPNFAFSHLAKMAPATQRWDLSSIRAFINCSEPCKTQTFERFLARFSASGIRPEALAVCYAMAENVFAVTQTPIGQAPRAITIDPRKFEEGEIAARTPGAAALRIMSCGRPIDNVRIRVNDPTGNDLPDNRVGEITIASPFLFSGYYKDATKTAETLKDGWYRTGDMGFTRDGELYVTGRADDMLILNGRNFYAHEVEEIVNGVSGVVPGRSVAFTLEDARTDAAGLVILAECFDDSDRSDVGRRVRTLLADHLGVGVFAFEHVPRGSLVKSTSGKLSRARNRQLYIAGAFHEQNNRQ